MGEEKDRLGRRGHTRRINIREDKEVRRRNERRSTETDG
jgi:hypothetical protein